ncbi:MAG: hypothetical protein R2710_30680 [Acidimicrobiales bacterium]
MHLVNFARRTDHGERIRDVLPLHPWRVVVPDRAGRGADRHRGLGDHRASGVPLGSSAPDFTMLLTSFGVHFVVEAIFLHVRLGLGRLRPRTGWIADTFSVGSVSIEVFDMLVIVVTLVVLGLTAAFLQRTMFGLSATGGGRGLRRRPS